MPRFDAILLELHYLPCFAYFSSIAATTTVYIEQHEHYEKGSWRNRCHLSAVNGVQRLTVPLRKGKNQQQPIREVRIAYDLPWQSQHWQSIQSAYGRAPFFEHYADYYRPFFSKKYEFLFDWNLDLLTLSLRLAGLQPALLLTTDYKHQLPENEADRRESFSPKKEPGAEFHFPHYSQVFEDRHGFLKNLSILDLLFCTGPQAGNVLRAASVSPNIQGEQ